MVENLDEIKKKDMHKVDMSTVMMKLLAVGKRIEKVPESPDPSPSKVPQLARDFLPVQKATSVPSKLGHPNLFKHVRIHSNFNVYEKEG